MRIAFIITRSDSIGGAHVYVRDVAKAFAVQGHEVTVLVGGEGPFTQELSASGIPWKSVRFLTRPIRPLTDLAGFWEIRRLLSESSPDLVSVHSSKAGWLGRLAARSLGLPVVFTVHGWAFTDGVPERQRRLYALAERIMGPLASRIITVSNYDRELALRHRIAPPEKIITVHNGVPDIGAESWANPEGSPPVIVMVARFEPPKDHLTLLRALHRLTDQAWQLRLVGDGPNLDEVRSEVMRLGLQERVHFIGRLRDVAACLASAQVFVLTSNWEGLPLSVLEAMRARLPVVATDVGGIKEAVVNGETGFLVARGDVATLADRLQQLLTDAGLRTRMGAAGRRRYETCFTFDRMFSRTYAVYERVVALAGKPALQL